MRELELERPIMDNCVDPDILNSLDLITRSTSRPTSSHEHRILSISRDYDPETKLLLPEDLCTGSLATLVNIASRSKSRMRWGGSPWHAHALIETALSMTEPAEFGPKNEILDRAEDELESALEKDLMPNKPKLEADILKAYMPAFRDRAKQIDPSPHAIDATYANLAKILLKYNDTYPTEQAFNDTVGICAQAEIAAIGMRSLRPEYFLWPASYREEQEPPANLNHDAYAIRDGKKIAIEIKLSSLNGRAYDPRVADFVYGNLGFDQEPWPTSKSSEALAKKSTQINDEWLGYDPEEQLPASFHGAQSSGPLSLSPNDRSPFVIHNMLHEVTSSLVCEALYGYMPQLTSERTTGMTGLVQDIIDNHYAYLTTNQTDK